MVNINIHTHVRETLAPSAARRASGLPSVLECRVSSLRRRQRNRTADAQRGGSPRAGEGGAGRGGSRGGAVGPARVSGPQSPRPRTAAPLSRLPNSRSEPRPRRAGGMRHAATSPRQAACEARQLYGGLLSCACVIADSCWPRRPSVASAPRAERGSRHNRPPR
jgi:hypothetical protein